jgi:hypothetical protein
MPTWTLLHKPGMITLSLFGRHRAVRKNLLSRLKNRNALHAVAPLNRSLWSRLVKYALRYGTSIVATSTVDRCPSITTIPLSVTK